MYLPSRLGTACTVVLQGRTINSTQGYLDAVVKILHSLLLKQSVLVIPLLIALCLNIFDMFSVHVNQLLILSFCCLLTIAAYTLNIFVIVNSCLYL